MSFKGFLTATFAAVNVMTAISSGIATYDHFDQPRPGSDVQLTFRSAAAAALLSPLTQGAEWCDYPMQRNVKAPHVTPNHWLAQHFGDYMIDQRHWKKEDVRDCATVPALTIGVLGIPGSIAGSAAGSILKAMQ